MSKGSVNMDFITYVLNINRCCEVGWSFQQNQAGYLVAFHVEYGSRIFHSETEFQEWLILIVKM